MLPDRRSAAHEILKIIESLLPEPLLANPGKLIQHFFEISISRAKAEPIFGTFINFL